MPRHRSEERTSLKRPLAILLALVIAGLAVFGVVQALTGNGSDTADPGDVTEDTGPTGGEVSEGSDGAPGDDTDEVTATEIPAAADCEEEHEVTVLASPDIAPVVTQLAEDADECTTYTVVAQGSLETVTALAGGQELTSLKRLLDETRVVGGRDHLHALCAREVRVLLDVLTDVRVRDARSVQGCFNVRHRALLQFLECAGVPEGRAHETADQRRPVSRSRPLSPPPRCRGPRPI